MLTERNVRSVVSNGAECFVCDRLIGRGETVIEITFKLILPIRKEMHLKVCAPSLRDLLDRKIGEAAR